MTDADNNAGSQAKRSAKKLKQDGSGGTQPPKKVPKPKGKVDPTMVIIQSLRVFRRARASNLELATMDCWLQGLPKYQPTCCK